MKIFYDNYIFSCTDFGGISHYMASLLKNIPKEYWYTSTIISNNRFFSEINHIKTYKLFPDFKFRGKNKIMTDLNVCYTNYKLKKMHFDVFHATWFLSPFMKSIKEKKVVVTIHDLIYNYYNKIKFEKINQKMIEFGKESVDRADIIIAVSQYTKHEIIKYWNISPDKIKVIYHGIDKNKLPINNIRMIDRPYIFFAGGNRGKNKNFEHLIEAFFIMKEKYSDLCLVCSGQPFSKEELSLLNEKKIRDKVLNVYATNQQMAQLYHDAEMLVVPSYYEGFGFPVLEAMLYNCPVVLANTTCLPEVGGNAGIYFDPYDSEDICNKMCVLLDDTEKRNTQIHMGSINLNRFSWQKCTKEHLNVYKSLL